MLATPKSNLTAMSKHHIIISGTGRTGTTFLVQLLTALGLDTGFADATSGIYSNCNAGMEWDLRRPDAPYIIKSPWLCDYLDEALDSGEYIIDHAVIPMRDLYSAAESRRDVTRRTKISPVEGVIPGGLWHTETPQEQESVLATQLYKLIHTISKRDIPITLLYFPRLIRDPKYLHGKLEFMLGGIGYQKFLETFKQIAQPDLVHEFRRPSTMAASTLEGENSDGNNRH